MARKKARCVILFITFVAALYVILPLPDITNLTMRCFKLMSPSETSEDTLLSRLKATTSEAHKDKLRRCGLPNPCPPGSFPFSVRSGAANVVPPAMCFNGETIMSGLMRNTGTGLNIAVIDARTGGVKRTKWFNMWHGEIKILVPFLKEIEENTFVLIATYDDGATKITDEARQLISQFGSSAIKRFGFRDNWVFAGGKGITGESPFEQHIKNNKLNNKYDNWPEMLEIEGCLPQKMD